MDFGLEKAKGPQFLSQVLFLLAGVSVVLAGVGAFVVDVYLASTQWLLVAIFLAITGVYVKLGE